MKNVLLTAQLKKRAERRTFLEYCKLSQHDNIKKGKIIPFSYDWVDYILTTKIWERTVQEGFFPLELLNNKNDHSYQLQLLIYH